MCGDWIYTVFDTWWRPSDEIEDDLGLIDGAADKLFKRLHADRSLPTEADRRQLCQFLALTACRHPDAMARGDALTREVALAMADASSYASGHHYLNAIERDFRFRPSLKVWRDLVAVGPDAAFGAVDLLLAMQPYHPAMPTHLATLCATLTVAKVMLGLDVILLDAPPGSGYVLGDTPVPLRNLRLGFDVPLSQSLAFKCTPTAAGIKPSWSRCAATAAEVDAVNANQRARARSIVIWPAA